MRVPADKTTMNNVRRENMKTRETATNRKTTIMNTANIKQSSEASSPRRSHGAVDALLCILIACPVLAARAQVFTDWQTLDENAQIAYGVLGSANVTLTGGNMKTAGSVLDGSSTVFASSYFTPSLATSDSICFEATSAYQTYRVQFSQPVQNPVLHLGSLASIVTLETTNITRLSGNSHFYVRAGTVVGYYMQGDVGDEKGSIRLNGVYSSFSFTCGGPWGAEGVFLQIGGTPVNASPTTLTPQRAIALSFPTELNKVYQVQYRTTLSPGIWSSLGGLIVGDGNLREIFDPANRDQQRFYRVMTLQ
jgi:hypothetical protein